MDELPEIVVNQQHDGAAHTRFAMFAVRHNTKKQIPSLTSVFPMLACKLFLHSVTQGTIESTKATKSKTVEEVKRSQ